MKKRFYRLNLGWEVVILALLMALVLGSGCEQSGEKSVEALYQQMRSHFAQERWSIALKECLELKSRLPESQLAGVFLTIGCCQYKLRKDEEALSSFQEVLNKYPDSKYVPDALLYSAYIYARNGEPEKAKEYCKRVIEDFPNTRQHLIDKSKKLLREIEKKKAQ